MTITSGFGFTASLTASTSRHWTMGADGVKRWSDTGEAVFGEPVFSDSDRLAVRAHNHKLLSEMRDALERIQPGYEYGVLESDVPRMRQWLADMIWTCEQAIKGGA